MPPSLEAELDRARSLDVARLADAIESIGFECTRCGACCKADGADDHVATVFPDEVRRIGERAGDGAGDDVEYDWRDVARPTPFGFSADPDGDGDGDGGDPAGETFEWALATDECGDCTFYEESDGVGACSVHPDRPLICRTYPFSVGAAAGGLGTTEPMGGVVEREGMVRAHECEGLGRNISRADAEELAAALKRRAVRELEEAIGVRDEYEPTDAEGVVVHDSEGQKRPDGSLLGTDP